MRKIGILLIAVMMMSLVACGGEKTSGEQTGTKTENKQDGENTPNGDNQSEGENTQTGEDAGNDSGSEEEKNYDITIGEKPSPIIFSAESGIYAEEFELTLTSSDSEVEIYYTTDGSNPIDSETSTLYEGAFLVEDMRGTDTVVSAVNPDAFAGSYSKVNSTRNGFDCEIEAPDSSAVDRCTTIRAVAKYSDGTYSYETSGVYFFGTMEEHIQGLAESCEASGTTLAVINISMDYEDLFDNETGIYVKGDKFTEALTEYLNSGQRMEGETARSLDANYKQKGREWERLARITFFECDVDGATEVLSQNCGIRIQGNYSRSDVQKGFRLYARSDYGDNNFRYAVFGEDYKNDAGETMDKFKTLVLRNGGNCAFTAKFNDTYWQSLLDDTKCDTQHSRPCVVYLNGEYWGLYVLQEDYSDDYFEDVHGVNKDDVVLYKGDAEALELGYKLDIGEVPENLGDEKYHFYELLGFFQTHSDLSDDADYAEFCEIVDPESLMDYFAAEIWINNKWDWPGKNWSMWKTTTDDGSEYGDGRWRFVFYDMEFGGVSGGGDAYTNTIKEDNYKTYGLLDMDTDNPAVLCFAYMMTNDTARAEFEERLLSLSENEFEKTAALERLDYFESVYGPLFDQFFERYPETGSADEALDGGYASSQCIRDFLNARENNIQRMVDWCEEHYN
ncbi:MAG: CotH kinase family protein [Lachnospiraceae bacterium]|nr:CotH kinase family protein [Lachnospiraceae bacterium]